MYKYLALFLIIGISNAGVLLTNGDFEQELDIGWTQRIQGSNSYDTLNRATGYDPDPDYEVKVRKYDAAYMKLYQTVNIPTTDLEFSVNANLYAYEYDPADTFWASASVTLFYLDNDNNVLGQTRICYNSPHCPYTNSDFFHMIEATSPNNWHNYSFNIDDELVELPGVNPADIAKIEVALYDTTNGC
ncbi:MAG: hypothetical protein JSV97_06090 [candidate division WOR-3 bacterium]|nr:MAG: hypothetical protein JSV97_06090 [candidate division WOR-3 bacterium]